MATVQQSIDIRAPAHAAYNQLMQFEDYPQFMEEVEAVKQIDDTHLHWTTIMSNHPVEWDAEITEREPDRCIAWHNTSGPTNSARVEVRPLGEDSARVIFTVDSQPQQVPGSSAGNSEQDLAQRLKMDLARLKDFVERRGSETGAWRGEMHGSPRSSPVPTSSYAAGSEGWAGDEDPTAPVTSAAEPIPGAMPAKGHERSQHKETAMQMVSEVMTRNVQFISPHENLQRAAQMMDELNVGALPVCDGERLVGMVTDRDITVRGIAAGRPPAEAHVDEVMSTDVRWCFEDQPLDDVMQQMADTQIRRVPVVSHDDARRLLGIVSLGDLATKTGDIGQVVKQVSSPSEPDRSGSRSRIAGGAVSGVSEATGSDTGTATGFAGADALGAAGSTENTGETGAQP